MASTRVSTPRLNTNEDAATIRTHYAALGDYVERGQLLVCVETVKAAVDIAAEANGYVRYLAGPLGASVPVGGTLVLLTDTADEGWTLPELAAAKISEVAPSRPTLRAQALARRSDGSTPKHTPNDVGKMRPLMDRLRDAIAEAGRDPVALIVGDGAHARYIQDLAIRAATVRVVGCTSQSLPVGSLSGSLLVLGTDDDLPRLRDAGVRCALVGIGSARSGQRTNATRTAIFDRLKELGFHVPQLIDPDASISPSAEIGEGSVVGARAVVSAHARIGRNVLVNVGAIVCHDAVVDDHVHLTPGAILAGTTHVGRGSTIGMAATVLDGTRVGRNCLVANGARVFKDLPDDAAVSLP